MASTLLELNRVTKRFGGVIAVNENTFDIKEGDTLILEEWDPAKKEYTGRSLSKKVGYKLNFKLDMFGQKEEVLDKGILILQLED